MTPRSRRTLSALALLAAASTAGGQTATVAVSHDHPTGRVQPGQTINVRVDVTWTGGTPLNWVLFAGLNGSVLPTPTTGTSSNITSIFEPGALVNPGVAELGGVTGIQIATTPQFGGCYPWPPPASGPNSLAGPFVAFDWTAPTDLTGEVTFAFTGAPNVRVFPGTANPNFTEALTTFVPVTLTVVPAPGGVAAGLLAGLAITGKRRPRQ